MSKVKFLVIAVCVLSFNLLLRAEPIEIIFTAANPPTLTRADVDAKLSEYDADELKANGFIAIIDDAITVIGEEAFENSTINNPLNLNLIEVIAPSVATIESFAFASSSDWSKLKNVNFPVATTIKNRAFMLCRHLISVDFPLVTTIEWGAFSGCDSLTSINFPVVETIQHFAFSAYPLGSRLSIVNFGTGFTEPTEIKFDVPYSYVDWCDVFHFVPTQNIDLVLGENVLPAPDLNAMTWQNIISDETFIPYVWKSITIKKVSVEEATKNLQVSIFPNPTVETATVSFELEKASELKITLMDLSGRELFTVFDGFTVEGFFTKTFCTKNLSSGVYFLQILIDGKYVVEKVVIEK